MISKKTALCICCLLLAFPACNHSQSKMLLKCRSTIGSSSTHSWIIQYGWDNTGSLRFVAFTGAKNPAKVKGIVVAGSDETYLLKPNGHKVILPSSNYQLFELVDGKFRQFKGDVTRDEMEKFVNSNPASYNIDSLIGFVRSIRGEHKKEEKKRKDEKKK